MEIMMSDVVVMAWTGGSAAAAIAVIAIMTG